MSKPISAGHLKLEREAREGISQNSTFTIVKIFNGATTLKETIQFCQTLDFFTSRKIQVDVLEKYCVIRSPNNVCYDRNNHK